MNRASARSWIFVEFDSSVERCSLAERGWPPPCNARPARIDPERSDAFLENGRSTAASSCSDMRSVTALETPRHASRRADPGTRPRIHVGQRLEAASSPPHNAGIEQAIRAKHSHRLSPHRHRCSIRLARLHSASRKAACRATRKMPLHRTPSSAKHALQIELVHLSRRLSPGFAGGHLRWLLHHTRSDTLTVRRLTDAFRLGAVSRIQPNQTLTRPPRNPERQQGTYTQTKSGAQGLAYSKHPSECSKLNFIKCCTETHFVTGDQEQAGCTRPKHMQRLKLDNLPPELLRVLVIEVERAET